MTKTKNDPNPPAIISLFTGAGGMDLGFEKAGFETIFANEFDPTIAPSYINHFPNVDHRLGSICEITDFPISEGVAGGPPCQAFSAAGAMRGEADARGLLVWEYLRVIKAVSPEFFVFENVPGLLHGKRKKTFEELLSQLRSAGYVVAWRVLDASDYNVPQTRKRVIAIGYRKDLGVKPTFPKPHTPKPTLKDTIHDLSRLVVNGTSKVPNHETANYHMSPRFLSRQRKRGWQEQSFTIPATDNQVPLHPGGEKMVRQEGITDKDKEDNFILAPGKNRRLTVRECARIQTFPDDYEFLYKNLKDGYKMVGNAVPVNLAFHIATQIRKDLG